MAWRPLLSRSLGESKLREVAHRVAAKCEKAVYAKVESRIGELGLAEARGYVRARSAKLLRQEVELVIAGRPRLSRSQDRLVAMASDATVRQIVWQSLRDRKQQTPLQAEPLRRAA